MRILVKFDEDMEVMKNQLLLAQVAIKDYSIRRGESIRFIRTNQTYIARRRGNTVMIKAEGDTYR